MNKKDKNILFGYFNFLWLLRSAQPSPEKLLNDLVVQSQLLIDWLLIKKKECSEL